MVLPEGKVPLHVLEKYIVKRFKPEDPAVIIGPGVGEDAALIKVDNLIMAMHCDPITGAVKEIGWLTVNIAANDVACRGARPRWLLITILLPQGAKISLLDELTHQIASAAKSIGVSIVGGHTEVTPGLNRPIVITTAIGIVEEGRIMAASNVRPGDEILMTKGAGIEGTAILATELEEKLKERLSLDVIEKAKAYMKLISVVNEAMVLAKLPGVHAMHDATEGGLLGAVQELARASGTGFIVWEDRVIIRDETKAICDVLKVDPLRLISSGTLVVAVEKGFGKHAVEALRKRGIQSSIIGKFTRKEEGFKLVRRDGTLVNIEKPIVDELWRVMSKYLGG